MLFTGEDARPKRAPIIQTRPNWVDGRPLGGAAWYLWRRLSARALVMAPRGSGPGSDSAKVDMLGRHVLHEGALLETRHALPAPAATWRMASDRSASVVPAQRALTAAQSCLLHISPRLMRKSCPHAVRQADSYSPAHESRLPPRGSHPSECRSPSVRILAIAFAGIRIQPTKPAKPKCFLP
jgi:hypothetical protein